MKMDKVLMLASVASMIDQFNMSNIRLLLDMGYEVHVACNFKEGNTCDGKRIGKFQKMLRTMGVWWYQWDCPRTVGSVSRCLRAYRQLWKITGRYHYKWIHCHSPVGSVLARVAAHRRKIPVVYTAHGFHFYRGAPWKNWLLYYPIEKMLAEWTDVLITINKEDYCFAQNNLRPGRIYRIPGIGIDTKHFFREPDSRKLFCRKYQIPEDATILLSVGELTDRKNHQAVIEVLAEINRSDIYYIICGQGILYRKLMEFAERSGIGLNIRMLGYQENMSWIYGSADIFIFPSMQEGLPVALMEAMAAGLPCIVSDIRGNRDLIDSYGGRWFPSGKNECLRKELEVLLSDRHLQEIYGAYNKRKIRAYDLTVVEGLMKKIYLEMEADAYAGENIIRDHTHV